MNIHKINLKSVVMFLIANFLNAKKTRFKQKTISFVCTEFETRMHKHIQ